MITIAREAVRHRKNVIPRLQTVASPTPFTSLFLLCLYEVRAGLRESGLNLSHPEALMLITLKEYLSAAGEMKITKRAAYNNVICQYLDFSYATFNRLFNSLVRKHCFNPLGTRGNGRSGLAEEYCLTTVSKRIDAIVLQVA